MKKFLGIYATGMFSKGCIFSFGWPQCHLFTLLFLFPLVAVQCILQENPSRSLKNTQWKVKITISSLSWGANFWQDVSWFKYVYKSVTDNSKLSWIFMLFLHKLHAETQNPKFNVANRSWTYSGDLSEDVLYEQLCHSSWKKQIIHLFPLRHCNYSLTESELTFLAQRQASVHFSLVR